MDYITDKNGNYEFPVAGMLKVFLQDCPDHGELNRAWNMAFKAGLKGKIDLAKLERALNRVIQEHDAMRASYSRKGDEYYIRVRKSYKATLKIETVNGATLEERKQEADRLIEEFAAEPINIYETVGYRIRIYQVDEEEYVMALNFQHALTDGASIAMMVGTWLAYYENEDIVILQSKGTFLDYASEEYNYLHSQDSQEEKKYWEDTYEGYVNEKYEVDEQAELLKACNISNMILNKDKLEVIARKNKTSVFNIVMMIYAMAIAKIENRNDVSIAFMLASRDKEEYRTTYGLITRTTNIRHQFEDEDVIGNMYPKFRTEIMKAVMNYRSSSDYIYDGYVIAYQNQNEGFELPTFEGNPITLNLVTQARPANWMVIRVNEYMGKVISCYECDTRKHKPDYLEKLKLAGEEAQDFILNRPECTFSDYIGKREEEIIEF